MFVYEPFKSKVSVPHIRFAFSDLSPTSFKSQELQVGGHLLGVDALDRGALCGDGPLTPETGPPQL